MTDENDTNATIADRVGDACELAEEMEGFLSLVHPGQQFLSAGFLGDMKDCAARLHTDLRKLYDTERCNDG